MIDINYYHKHVFLAHSNCKFICNLLINLINKNVIDKSSILLVVYGEISTHSPIRKTCLIEDLELIEWTELKGKELSFTSKLPAEDISKVFKDYNNVYWFILFSFISIVHHIKEHHYQPTPLFHHLLPL